MSAFRSDKCSSEELKEFKNKVIDWLKSIGIKTEKLDIRSYKSYNGDIRIFTGDYMEIANTKSSFRRTEARKNEKGEVIGYYGTRGHHTTRYVSPIIINRDEFDFFVKEYFGENKSCYDDYKKLDALKNT